MTEWKPFEQSLRAQGIVRVCGVDEAGRGPLAGPVYAAAVILPPDVHIDGLNDSKKLSEKKREALFPVICDTAVAYSIACADEKEIDAYNILQATYLAMRRAVDGLPIPAEYALIDGNRMPPLLIPGETIIKGDAICQSIAAASVLAKVSRDRFMLEMDRRYPQYAFAQHKGYGTQLHYEKLRQFGPSEIHRMTFLKKMH